MQTHISRLVNRPTGQQRKSNGYPEVFWIQELDGDDGKAVRRPDEWQIKDDRH